MKKLPKILTIALLVIALACLVLTGLSALNNRRLPVRSSVIVRLSEADQARLAEAQHLRRSLGDAVFPGWGQADIPVILYNEEYAFLAGLPDPADGWVKVPAGLKRGGLWELVPGGLASGEDLYSQRLPGGVSPEAFAVQVGERWVASLGTYEWMQISVVEPIRRDLPAPLRPVFPYRLLVGQLLGGSEKYITLILHESFHAFQGSLAPQRLAAATSSNRQADNYPWDEAAFHDAWQAELDVLSQAMLAKGPEEARRLAVQFLALRQSRRSAQGLTPAQIDYERQYEWLEGLARYAEVEIWQQAASDPAYRPLPAIADLPGFKDYRGSEQRLQQEASQTRRMAGDQGEGRFYYSGMAQARLLNLLAPGWQSQAMAGDAALEDLLRQAVE